MSWQAPSPDPTNPDLLLNIFAYLASEENVMKKALVRDPEDGSNELPPMWIAPRYGCPAPGEETEGGNVVEVGRTMVTAIEWATGVPPGPYEGFMRMDAVTFTLRCINAQMPYSLENEIRACLNDRRGWLMEAVPINESMLVRAIQPVNSDEHGWTFNFQYLFNLQGPFTVPQG